MSQLIDRYSGSFRLEKNLILTPGLSPDELIELVGARATGSFAKNSWYSDIRMETDAGPLTLALFFKGERLREVHASITTGYGPPNALIKAKHDELLIGMLGRPTEEKPYSPSFFERIIFKRNEKSWHKTAKDLIWRSPWGMVTSTIEPRDGSAQFRIKWK